MMQIATVSELESIDYDAEYLDESITWKELEECDQDFNQETVSWAGIEFTAAEIAHSLWNGAKTATKKCRKTLLGFINALIYCAAKRSGLLDVLNSDPESLKAGVERFLQVKSVEMPITWLAKHITQWWGEVKTTTTRKVVDVVASFGLFTRSTVFESKRRKNTPSAYHNIDLKKLLKVYELLEQWVEKDQDWGSLPDHKGNTTRLIYNAVFRTGMGYNRNEPEFGIVTHEDTTEEQWAELREERDLNIEANVVRRIYAIEEILESETMPLEVVESLSVELEELNERLQKMRNRKPAKQIVEPSPQSQQQKPNLLSYAISEFKEFFANNPRMQIPKTLAEVQEFVNQNIWARS